MKDPRTPTTPGQLRWREMVPGRLWAVQDTRLPEDSPSRITFHYTEQSALRHCETGRPR